MIPQWHELIEKRDIAGLEARLAENVILHSPVVHTPISGKKTVHKYLSAAFHIFLNEHFHYRREVISKHNAVLEFETEIDGVHINGVDMIQWNDEDQIVDFKVMLRPLKAVNIIHEKMAAMLKKT